MISLFVDKLTIVDYAYYDSMMDKAVGDTVFANIKVIGELDNEGVVFDFSLCKKAIKKIIDEEIDHKLVVPAGIIDEAGEEYSKISKLGSIENYTFPNQAVTELDSNIANLASISSHLQNKIMAELKDKDMSNVVAIEVALEPEQVGGAYYRYTHGLKDHYGNCQRLIHGHRSSISVYVDEVRASELESELAALSHNKHFVFNETLKDSVISYKSSQGEFRAEFKKDDLITMNVESTVENIALFFATYLRRRYPDLGQITVQAYEGIEKGAIAVG